MKTQTKVGLLTCGIARHACLENGYTHIWASTLEKLSWEFPTKGDLNQSPQTQRLAKKIEILPGASLDVLLSNK